MFNVIVKRIRQGYRTMKLPVYGREGAAPLPARFRGLPRIDASRCRPGCSACAASCPTGAIQPSGAKRRAPGSAEAVTLDLGRCLFCGDCSAACPEAALSFSHDWRLAARKREDLIVSGLELARADALAGRMRRLLGRSLKLRQVSAGGCNACEADCNVLSTIGWDMGRFGIQFVASPRHADGVLVTGPVTRNMALALKKTHEAIPSPKIVIAVGACALSGGPYIGSEHALDGVGGTLDVDLFIPGCPPHPLTILDGLLRLLGRLR
jgi:Ni,Fe-hydrogenase III small subunit/formate hydrogenlyase subunit 6/NADH:ubiquinone oxidoreductase subunit I